MFLEILKGLIDAGADVRLKDAQDANALVQLTNSRFAHPDYYAMARFLIDHGADVNGKSVDGCTPLLYISVFYSGPDLINIVRMLVQAGTDVGIKENKMGRDAAYFLNWRKILPHQEIDTLLSP